jgi:hypothetical protein
MQVVTEILKGKIVKNGDKLKDIFSSIEDGTYIISVNRVNSLVTPRDYQKAYFDMVDIAVSETGNARYVIHDEFKKHAEVESTKDLGILEWRDLLQKFRWWAYNNFDCVV